MSDLLNQDAILSTTILKPCKNCGHTYDKHVEGKQCKIKNCSCERFE